MVDSNTRDQGFTYDPFGNLTAVSGRNARTLATYQSSNRLDGAGYDGRGNMTSWGTELYTYDALGMMSTKNYPEETYIYTADEERLWSFRWYGDFNVLVESWTVRDLDAKVLSIFANPKGDDPWDWEKDYVYRGGQLLAADAGITGALGKQHFSVDHP